MTTMTAHVPGEDIRIVQLPDVVRASAWPGDGVEVPHVVLDSLMRDEFRLSRCRHDDVLQFTVPGWRVFLAAVKAGEFDHLAGEEPQ